MHEYYTINFKDDIVNPMRNICLYKNIEGGRWSSLRHRVGRTPYIKIKLLINLADKEGGERSLAYS